MDEPKNDKVDTARILVLDEHPFIREGVKQHVNRQPGLQVCFDTGDIGLALEGIEKHDPHLLLLEVRLSNGDVLEFIKSVKARFPLVRMLILSQFDERFYAERALRAGAHGFVMKQESSEEVIAAIWKVLKGELYVSKSMASSLLSKLLQAPISPGPRPLEGLSDREFQVFHMLGAGMGSRQIAAHLNLSVKTIETYRENIKHKFGIRTSAELLRYATQWSQSRGPGEFEVKSAPVPAICAPDCNLLEPAQPQVASLGKYPL